MFSAFLIKYAEIAIKGKNRRLFEDALVRNIRISLSRVEGNFRVRKENGRVFLLLSGASCKDEQERKQYPTAFVLPDLRSGSIEAKHLQCDKRFVAGL